jgi:hypothetical protein
MIPQVPDELISAYFDGEVSPEERAAVERLLAESDEAQRDLNETARLSALLHSFPRESAPAELVANVLRRTNEISLPAPPVIAAQPTPRNVWRERTAALIGCLTTLASLAICWGLASQFNILQQDRVVVETHGDAPALSTPVDPMAAHVSRDSALGVQPELESKSNHEMQLATQLNEIDAARGSARRGDSFEHLEDATKRSSPVAAKSVDGISEPADAASIREFAKKATPAPPAMAGATLDSSDAPSQLNLSLAQQIDSSQFGLSNEAFVQGLHEGKVYSFVPQPADPDSNVAVVYVTVVDIDRSVEKIQVLLRKNSIEPRSVTDEGDGSSNDLAVVYAVAPGEKLAQTLKDVENHRDLFGDWSSQPPLQVAAIVASEKSEKEVLNRRATEAKDGAAAQKLQFADKANSASEVESDKPEAQRVFEAYAMRNSLQNSIVTDGTLPEVSRARSLGGSENRGAQQRSISPDAGNSAQLQRNKGAPSNNQDVATQGYDVLRLKNSISQANAPLRSVRQEKSLSSLPNPVFTAPQEKALADEVNNRALRVLFVLQPQAEAVPASPSAPAPSK